MGDFFADTMGLFFPDHPSSFGKPGNQALAFGVVAAAHVALLGLIATVVPAERIANLTRPFIARVIELAPEVPPPPAPTSPVAAPPKQPTKKTSAAPRPVRIARAPKPAPEAATFSAAPQPPVPVEPASVPTAAVAAPAEPVVAARFDADYLHNPKPVYPNASRRLGEQGKVVLRVHVSAAGLPEKIEVSSSSGFARLDRAAEEAVSRWRFVPAQRGPEAIAAWVRVPIRFQLDS
jgi:protein TonB